MSLARFRASLARSRQEGCIPWQLKSITVPLQDTHTRIKSLEERVGLPFWSQMHSVVADFLRGFPVSFIWIDACTKSMSDKLTSQTDLPFWEAQGEVNDRDY